MRYDWAYKLRGLLPSLVASMSGYSMWSIDVDETRLQTCLRFGKRVGAIIAGGSSNWFVNAIGILDSNHQICVGQQSCFDQPTNYFVLRYAHASRLQFQMQSTLCFEES